MHEPEVPKPDVDDPDLAEHEKNLPTEPTGPPAPPGGPPDTGHRG